MTQLRLFRDFVILSLSSYSVCIIFDVVVVIAVRISFHFVCSFVRLPFRIGFYLVYLSNDGDDVYANSHELSVLKLFSSEIFNWIFKRWNKISEYRGDEWKKNNVFWTVFFSLCFLTWFSFVWNAGRLSDFVILWLCFFYCFLLICS